MDLAEDPAQRADRTVPPGPERNRRRPLAERIQLAGVGFDKVTLDEAVDIVAAFADGGRRHHVVTGNVDHLMLLRTDATFRKAYELADLRVADGAPIVLLSRLVGTPLPERVTGSDLFPRLLEMAERKGLSVGFLGGRDESIPLASARLAVEHPNLRLAGAHCPPHGFEDDPVQAQAAIDFVSATAPDLLFVCLGAPKQENWWAWNFDLVPPMVAIHCGAALDFYAGVVERAPVAYQRLGLEWLYRLKEEPGRMWRRYLVRDSRFVGVLVRETLKVRIGRLRKRR